MNIKFFLYPLLFFNSYSLAQKKQEILFCSEFDNPIQQELTIKNKIQNVYIFYQDFILNKDSMLDQAKLAREVIRQIPNKHTKGYAVLDIEGESLLILLKEKNAGTREYMRVLNNYINTIKFAKSLRPNIKWAFYGFNLTSYPYVTDLHKKIVQDTYPLLREQDFLAPSMYLQDKKTDHNLIKINKFVLSNINYSIEISKKLSKPVYPFIWNRYHNVESSNTLIDPKDFKWYIDEILNTEFKGSKVNGIVFWNSETYTYKNNKDENVRKEYVQINNFDEYQKNLLQTYLNKLTIK